MTIFKDIFKILNSKDSFFTINDLIDDLFRSYLSPDTTTLAGGSSTIHVYRKVPKSACISNSTIQPSIYEAIKKPSEKLY